MPDIKQSYQITNISLDNVYQESLQILKNLGASDIKENAANPTASEAMAMIPGIWGWGGMNISVRLEPMPDNNVLLILNGYIAQFGITPLTKKMDKFLQQLQSVLKLKYKCSFEYEKLTRFLPKYKLSINKNDKKVFIAIIIMFLIGLLIELSGHGAKALIIGIVVLIGYVLGKKYLNK